LSGKAKGPARWLARRCAWSTPWLVRGESRVPALGRRSQNEVGRAAVETLGGLLEASYVVNSLAMADEEKL
jgi:hypothetical protein